MIQSLYGINRLELIVNISTERSKISSVMRLKTDKTSNKSIT